MDIETILCPCCGDNLKIGEADYEPGGEIANGYAYCHCSEYPIAFSILYLRNDQDNRKVIEKIKSNAIIEAALSLMRMSENDQLWFRKIDRYSFIKLMQKNDFGNYLTHRFSSETFWLLFPCTFLADKMGKTEKILDLACGTGHSSYVLHAYLEPEELVCADINFWHLFLLKHFFVPDAFGVCVNANNNLPFENNYFDYINMMDAFHSIDNKSKLSQEFVRILDSKGLFSLPHLHNSLQFNYGGESLKGMTPREWRSLFAGWFVKAIPDESLLKNFLFLDKLDLNREYSRTELSSSNSITLLGRKDSALDKLCLNGIWRYILNTQLNLIVNPIYEIEHQTNSIILHRQFPSEFFRKNYPITEQYLPERHVIEGDLRKVLVSRNLLRDELNEKMNSFIEEMMQKFILVNAPLQYTS